MGFLLFYIKTFTLQYRTESTEERRIKKYSVMFK